MLDHTAIKLALRNRVRTTVGDFPPDERIAFENIEFNPPAPDLNDIPSCAWAREGYAPGDEVQTASDTVEGPGVYTLDILVPKGSGTSWANALQKAVAEALHPATDVVGDDGTVVHIDRTARLPGRVEDDLWYVVSVQCTWRSYDIG